MWLLKLIVSCLYWIQILESSTKRKWYLFDKKRFAFSGNGWKLDRSFSKCIKHEMLLPVYLGWIPEIFRLDIICRPIRNPIWTSKNFTEKIASRNSAYLYHIRSFIFYLIENYKVSSKTPEEFRGDKTEEHLSFFIDAYFDKSNRKWFWGNKNEIQADQWAYQCSNLPHQPATDLVVTIKFTGNFHIAKTKISIYLNKIQMRYQIFFWKSSTDALPRGIFRRKSMISVIS